MSYSSVRSIELPGLNPGKLFGGPYPYSPKYRAQLIGDSSIQAILNLTESPYHSEIAQDFKGRAISVFHLPVRDFNVPPSIENLHAVLCKIEALILKGKHVYIHCQAGRGRTGMITACLAVQACHLPSDEAIKLIRRFIPGAIETKLQEQFISKYEDYLKSPPPSTPISPAEKEKKRSCCSSLSFLFECFGRTKV